MVGKWYSCGSIDLWSCQWVISLAMKVSILGLSYIEALIN